MLDDALRRDLAALLGRGARDLAAKSPWSGYSPIQPSRSVYESAQE